MPLYVMLSRPNAEGLHNLYQHPDRLDEVRREIEALDAKIIHRYALPGNLSFLTVVEAGNNLEAFRLAVERVSAGRVSTTIYPAMDLDLFSRLLTQTTETTGPFRWQTSLWARAVRRVLRYNTITSTVRKYLKPLTIEGRENLSELNGPAIFIGNHSSHMDLFVLFSALPKRYQRRIAWGGAADRWFIKGRKGIKKQPWYFALSMNAFPVQRGGGRAALSYAEELLDRGWSLGIFPEGTRTTTGKMGKFRHGVSILALAKDVPVVPVWMDGLRAMRPKGTKEITPGPALARIGKPIRFAPGTTVADATHTLHQTMVQMRDDIEREQRASKSQPIKEARKSVTETQTAGDRAA
ncbi:MAG TPA: 1-acyl-sn-glycerol-3-phosphate acyltransferase [Candidatus Binataceae bacterium]|nr:1-acyl-sn-glycerol-3-phosphate acyltransferase [Candidatus Binataceae bacterium]